MQASRIPVVIIHRGDSAYLPAAIFQLQHTNPKSEIYLIGDEGNKRYDELLSHVDIRQFSKSADQFKNIYKHFSTNGYEFELICIQRWYILNDFLKKKNIERCLYIDSDVLVYCDIDTAQKKLQQFGMTVSGISAHTNFINSSVLLDEFCQFVTDLYSSERSNDLAIEYDSFLKKHDAGGISDMTMFTKFRSYRPESIGDLAVPQKDNSVFDITLDTIQDYEFQNGVKRVVWRSGMPTIYNKHLNSSVTFNTLHFQGKCKSKIYDYTTLQGKDKLKCLVWRAGYYKNKVLKKVLS
jgi:hypothetical protein